MEETSTLNRVVDIIFDSDHLEITDADLDEAISAQLMKVMNFAVTLDPIITASVTVMYILLMIKHKSVHVDNHFPHIGISSEQNRTAFIKAKKEAHILAAEIFKQDIQKKL